MNWVAVFASGMFVLVGGFMNFTFASTLGTDALTTRCWQALSVGATLYTVVGVSLAVEQWRENDRPRAIAASAVLALALAYDWSAAYGFSARQHSETAIITAEKARAHRDAKEALQLAQTSFEPYRDAPDVEVAQREDANARADLDAIDRAPGVVDRLGPCREPRSAGAREMCARRPAAVEAAQRASTELARAQAKARLLAEIEKAQTKLTANPPTPPADPRADLFGARLIELLPVALLMGGSLFGFFAAGKPQKRSPAPDQKLEIRATDNSEQTPNQAPVPRKRAKPGADKLARKLREIQADATSYGLVTDGQGWIRGSQRAFAGAAGLATQSSLNRAIHDAAAAGLIEVDTTGKDTAIRVIKT